jgi:hypothetical protein
VTRGYRMRHPNANRETQKIHVHDLRSSPVVSPGL